MFWFKKKKKLVTHSGSFHADDVFACAVLNLYFKKNKIKFSVTRSRDESIIRDADYVFDVGGVYDPEKNRFDHHQPGGAGMRKNKIPYAAFGLVWKKFGPLLCNHNMSIVHDLDRRLVQPIDAIDNGISITEPNECGLYDYGIHGIVNAYQNTWKESHAVEKQHQSFMQLVSFFTGIIEREIERSQHHLEMLDLIEGYYQKSQHKEIIEVPHHVSMSALMQVLDKYKEVMYVVSKSNINWKVVAVRKSPCTFENRKSLPVEWSGKRKTELQKVTGVSDAIFCHNALWMAVARSRIGAWQLAELALLEK